MPWPKGRPRLAVSGRKKGTANKETKPLREMILQALTEQEGGGVAYLKRQAKTNPGSFVVLLGKVLPLAVTGADGTGPVVIEIVKFGEK